MFFSPNQSKRHACHKCSEELVFEVKIGRRDMCPNCGAYLHCCLNCQHHDRHVHNECKENRAEFIRDRTEGNFCLYFDFRLIPEEGQTEEDMAKSRLNALFGGDGPKRPSVGNFASSPKTEDDARQRLENLFKK